MRALGVRSILLAALAFACAPSLASAAPAALPKLRLKTVGTFTQPTYVAAAPKDTHRIYVLQKNGVIRVIKDGRTLRTPFLDLSKRVYSDGEERGALSLAFAPDYASSGLFYFAFNALNGDITLEEYRRKPGNADVADPHSRRVVFVQRHPNHNHNSGQLQFGPDGRLYMGIGDGGGSGDKENNAQNLLVRLGKILRLNPRAGQSLIPSNNPFAAESSAAPEIYAYGFRNPWRFSFDRLTGGLSIADVGQDEVEEIDYAAKGRAAGRNFGWNKCEGDQAFPPVGTPRAKCALKGSVAPSITMLHKQGYCAVIGGYVVRDKSLGRFYGRYLYGDWCKVGMRTARLGVTPAKRDDRAAGVGLVALTSFGEDAGGCLYATSITGIVARIQGPAVRRSTAKDDDKASDERDSTPGDGTTACMPLK